MPYRYTGCILKFRTVSHAHRHVIDRFPVREGLIHGSLPAVIARIVIMLQEMADQEFAFRLCAEEQPEAEGVEYDPDKGMNSVKGESCGMGQGRDEGGEENVADDQEELEVRCTTWVKRSITLFGSRIDVIELMPRETYRNGSKLWKSTTSLRKYRLNMSC